MEEEQDRTMSLRGRRKKSSVGISCCFSGTTQHHRRASFDAASYSSTPIPHPSPRRSPSAWFKSRTNDLPEIKGKCRNFISRMARHRRHSSADFSYDPLSYSLNFDDDAASADDEFRAMNFTARLPVSPPRRTAASPFDHNLPRTPEAAGERWKREESATPKIEAAAGSDDLRRGFEALSVSMKKSSVKEPGQRRNTSELSSPRAAAVAEVKKSLKADEEVASPAGISSNREILVQLC